LPGIPGNPGQPGPPGVASGPLVLEVSVYFFLHKISFFFFFSFF
jgi:hypothetical protein